MHSRGSCTGLIFSKSRSDQDMVEWSSPPRVHLPAKGRRHCNALRYLLPTLLSDVQAEEATLATLLCSMNRGLRFKLLTYHENFKFSTYLYDSVVHPNSNIPSLALHCDYTMLSESVFSSDHEKYWKQKRTITRFRLYKKSFSKLNTNTTYLEKMQCFSFAERIATSFCNHQSTKTKKPQKRG